MRKKIIYFSFNQALFLSIKIVFLIDESVFIAVPNGDFFRVLFDETCFAIELAVYLINCTDDVEVVTVACCL